MCTVYAPIAFLRVLWLGLAVFHVNGWCTKSQSVTFVAMNDLFAHHANIKVLGVGGAGGNAVNRMILLLTGCGVHTFRHRLYTAEPAGFT